MNSETTSKLNNSVTQVLVALVPSLGPYGAVIGLAMGVAETVAPEIYEEIKSLISKITDGHDPTEAELTLLASKIADLKKPEVFFQTPLPVTVEAGKDVTVQIPAAAPAPVTDQAAPLPAESPAPVTVAAIDPAKCPTCGMVNVPNHPENCNCVNA